MYAHNTKLHTQCFTVTPNIDVPKLIIINQWMSLTTCNWAEVWCAYIQSACLVFHMQGHLHLLLLQIPHYPFCFCNLTACMMWIASMLETMPSFKLITLTAKRVILNNQITKELIIDSLFPVSLVLCKTQSVKGIVPEEMANSSLFLMLTGTISLWVNLS